MQRITRGLSWAALVVGLVFMGGAQRGAQDPGPVLTRHTTNHRDWTLTYEMRLHAYREQQRTIRHIPETGRIVLGEARLVFPVVGSSASHDAHVGRFAGRVRVNNVTKDDSPEIVEGYQGGSSIAVWAIEDVNTTLVTLETRTFVTSYETRIDEKRAVQIGWPEEDWAPVIAGCLEPQLFVEPDHPAVQTLVKKWTDGKSRKAKPYTLAKYLAGKVLEYVRVSGSVIGNEPEYWRRSVQRDIWGVQGFWLNELGVVAEHGQGSPLDMVNLLCSVYRAAGLPSRVVIAEDHNETIRGGANAVIHAWVEFYLYDKRWDRGEWIPVDIIHQREYSSRAPRLEQRWQHFGHSEELDFMVPFANHWIPPTAVRTPGPAAMWGWVTEPAEPLVIPELRLLSMETSKRGDDPEWEVEAPAGMGEE